MAEMARTRVNARYLPEAPWPDALQASADLEAALADTDMVVLAVPSHALRETAVAVAQARSAPPLVVWAAKGFDPQTGGLLHDTVADVFGPGAAAAVLSGPTFAAEVGADLPAAVTIASTHPGAAAHAVRLFHGGRFRAYTSTDVVGVEVGGAVKNVLAIAAGIADGLGFGANTRAALVTRGLAELTRLGLAFGGQRETFMGLAGLGDLMLTCSDNQSRNRRFGLAIAAGASSEEAAAEVGQVVEGLHAARHAARHARAFNVEMPITEQVHAVLHEGSSPRAAVEALLSRAPASE
ncbi:MAG: NAD(P)H-dependent glycerol-3-phosphate dehydrogenase, partial [Gammaproteobacteria bacterium]